MAIDHVIDGVAPDYNEPHHKKLNHVDVHYMIYDTIFKECM